MDTRYVPVPTEPPETHGAEAESDAAGSTAGSASAPTWREVEALAAILEPEAFDADQAADETWRKVTQNRALAHAAKVVAAGYVRVPRPELVTLPTFKGCTNSNPDYCACNEGAICCAACGDEIDEGSEAWALSRPLLPWTGPEGDGQEIEDLVWHTNCDLRGGA